jgi:hypothetical protein
VEVVFLELTVLSMAHFLLQVEQASRQYHSVAKLSRSCELSRSRLGVELRELKVAQ